MLMIPAMYAMGGQFLPSVMHIASRVVTSNHHSIFGDHTDFMTCRMTGYAMLMSSCPQEAMDLAAVAHLSAISGRYAFMHCFDGFRTSHEMQRIEALDYEDLRGLVDQEALQAFRHQSLNPEHPTNRGNNVNPDVYFQCKEGANVKANALPDTAVPGITVEEAIDWDWRFDKMQQHTGEHILSGILHQMFGAENVGFHIGSEAVRMDTSVPISAEGLRAAELAANRIVWQDVPVLVSYPTREELAALVYRSKKEIEGQVRIVTIPGADVCACCGTHTRTTGQVGQIKILASENYKGGVRLSVVCGARALEAAQAMRARQADIGALLSAKADQTAVAVHRVYDEYTALKFTHFGVCSQLFDALAQLANPGEDAIRTVPGLDPDGLHRLAVRLTEATTGLCTALTPTEKGTGYCIAQADGDVRALTKALNAALNGRGGGKPGICQGSCAAAPEQVEEFLRKTK